MATKKKTEEVVETKTEPVAKTVAKKKPAKTTKRAKKEPAPVKVVIQANGNDYDISDLSAKVVAAYKANNPRKSIKKVDIYVKPEEGQAYYAINDKGSDDYKIDL